MLIVKILRAAVGLEGGAGVRVGDWGLGGRVCRSEPVGLLLGLEKAVQVGGGSAGDGIAGTSVCFVCRGCGGVFCAVGVLDGGSHFGVVCEVGMGWPLSGVRGCEAAGLVGFGGAGGMSSGAEEVRPVGHIAAGGGGENGGAQKGARH
jgi:hypothetical protein